jgi:transposase
LHPQHVRTHRPIAAFKKLGNDNKTKPKWYPLSPRPGALRSRSVRHYAKARGKWAKTDPIDARLIAEFARDLGPELRPFTRCPDASTSWAMSAAQPTAGDGADGKNRLQRAPRANQKSIKAMLRFLRRQIEQVEKQIEHSIRKSLLWQAKRELL